MSLWQKPEHERTKPEPQPTTSSFPKSSTPVASTASGFIGQSIQINGELTGNEDLVIDGRVEGKIDLRDHNLTVGENGNIEADIHAKAVTVKGQVLGNVNADDKVEITPSGSVEGDLCAPRVALADGSSFKGAIDMSGSAPRVPKTPTSSANATAVPAAAAQSAGSGHKHG